MAGPAAVVQRLRQQEIESNVPRGKGICCHNTPKEQRARGRDEGGGEGRWGWSEEGGGVRVGRKKSRRLPGLSQASTRELNICKQNKQNGWPIWL